MIAQTILQSSQSDILNQVYAAQLANTFNADNTATGVSSVTLNGRSGVATFTQNITQGTVAEFTINNSSVTADSIMRFTIQYEPADSEMPIFGCYHPDDGVIHLMIGAMPGAFDVTESIEVEFQIIG